MPVPSEDSASPIRQIESQYQQWTKTYKRNKIESVQEGRAYLKRATSLLPILEAFVKLHPTTKIVPAVNSFRSVVELEQLRPGSDARMTAIFVVETDVMGVLFNVSRKKTAGSDNDQILSDCLRRVNKEIRSCGNSMDTYYSKNARMLQAWKAQEWKERMLKHCTQFVTELAALEHASATTPVSDTEALIKKFKLLYTHLFAPKEDWEKKLINTAHQLKKSSDSQDIFSDPAKLRALVQTTEDAGFTQDELSGKDEEDGFKSSLPTQLEQLKDDLSVSLDVLCKRNEDTFSLKLDYHTKQLQESINNSAAFVVKSLSGPYDRLHHPDLKILWKEMNWIFCVDNSHFTSALFEYYLDHFSTARIRPPPNADAAVGESNKDKDKEAEDLAQANLSKVTFLSRMGVLNHPDTWALESIAMYGDRIANSIDRDDSGFIRISEVNAFTDKMPKGWSLPQWCAYAAIGWAYEARLYRKRIQHLLGKMFEMQAKVLPANRGFLALQVVEEVIEFYQLLAWEPSNVESPDPPDELRSLVHQKVKSQDDSCREGLGLFKWKVVDETTLKLLFDKQPLESYLLQLSVLLLEHTYQVMQVGTKFTIDSKEVQHLLEPLELLERLVARRVQGLKDQFAKEKKDTSYIGTYSGGIFYSYVSWWEQDFLPFHAYDIYDFGRDESLVKYSAAELAPDALPYLRYKTWEEHIKSIPEHEIPAQIPDTWNVERYRGAATNIDNTSTRHESADFPLTFHPCRRCQTDPMTDFHYMCLTCEDFFLCSECYHISLNGSDTPEPHDCKHPVVRLALHTVDVQRKWIALDAEVQLQQIRVSLVSKVMEINNMMEDDDDDDEETAHEDSDMEEDDDDQYTWGGGEDDQEDDQSDHEFEGNVPDDSDFDDSDDDDYFDGGAIPEEIIPSDFCDHCNGKIDLFDEDTTFYKCFRHCCTNFWLCADCANQHITSEDTNGHQWWHSVIVVRPALLLEEEMAAAAQSQAPPTEQPSAIEVKLSALETKLDTTTSTLKTSNATLEERMNNLEGKVDMMFSELRTFIASFPRDSGAHHSSPLPQQPAPNVVEQSFASNQPRSARGGGQQNTLGGQRSAYSQHSTYNSQQSSYGHSGQHTREEEGSEEESYSAPQSAQSNMGYGRRDAQASDDDEPPHSGMGRRGYGSDDEDEDENDY